MVFNILNEIKKVSVFQGCDEAFISEVVENIRISQVPLGQTIVSRGDETKDVYINFDGLLDITYLLEDGKKVTFDLITPYRLFGEISSIDGKSRSASISCFTKVNLGTINHKFFINKMLENKNFLRGLLNRFSLTIRKNNQQIVHLASADSRKKVIIQLLRLSRSADDQWYPQVVEGISHDALASFIGLSRETVTRVITLLKKDGLILQVKKGIISLNIDKISSEMALSGEELLAWS